MPYYPPPSTGGSSEFTDGGTILYPADNSGQEDVAIGGTTVSAPIILKGVNGSEGQARFKPTSPINNHIYSLLCHEATTNLVTNPSFEVDTTGWSAYGSNSAISRSTSEKYVGDASCQVAITPATASSGIASSSITTTVSKPTILSISMKGASGGEAVALHLVGSNSGSSSTNITLTTSWKRYYLPKTLNASDTSCIIRVITQGATAPTFYIDAVMLEQKDSSSYSTTFNTPYCDGSLGAGHEWTGTAHASTSTRDSGLHILSQIASSGYNGFAIKPDGTISISHIHFKQEATEFNSLLFGALNGSTIRAPFYFEGEEVVSLYNYGNIGGLVGIYNAGNGPALYVKGASTTQPIAVIDGGSETTGTIFLVYAPSDLSTFSGSFLNFADKSGASTYDFRKNSFRIGSANLNQRHIVQGLGAGKFNTTSTTKTGTISSSSTTVTGSGTSFTTEYSVGDVIVASGQRQYITGIASNTSLTTLTAFNPAISAGTSHAKLNSQYEPFLVGLEDNDGDHQVLDYVGKFNSFFFSSRGLLTILRPTESAGTGTLSSSGTTVTGSGTSFTTQLSVGDIIISASQRLRVLAIASNTSLTTETAASPALSANSFTYIDVTTSTTNADGTIMYEPNVPFPSADTSGLALVHSEYKDTASKTTTSNTSEQSIFTTTPTIPAGRMGATGTIRITAFGTLGAAGATKTLTFRVKLGSTTILTTHAETIAETNAMNWTMVIVIQNTATNAQKTSLEFKTIRQNTSNATAAEIIMDYETAAANTLLDQVLDITAQYGTVSSTITKESILVEVF